MRHKISSTVTTWGVLCGWLLLNPVAVGAQRASQAAFGDTPTFLVAAEGNYGGPLRAAGGLSLILPIRKWQCEDGYCGGQHIEIQASAGAGGWRAAGGLALIGYPFRSDLLFTVTRTSSSPRGASSDSTYAGVEGGFAMPVYPVGKRSFISVRPAIGVAHRVAGPAGPHGTTFTWSVGATLLWPKL